MADQGAQLTEGFALQPLVEKAKSLSGSALVQVVQEALEHPLVLVFQELLDLPNVQKLATEQKDVFDLLNIFAYGTLSDYLAASGLPQLTPQQKLKLQRLTLVSLSAQSHVLPYALLQKELQIASVRELEDLVIESIYAGVIQGRIDQRKQEFEIHFAIGRDVQPKEIDSLMQTLLAWYKNCDDTVKAMEDSVGFAHSEHLMNATHRQEFNKQVEMMKAEMKMRLEQMELASRGGGGMMSLLSGFGDDRSRKGRF